MKRLTKLRGTLERREFRAALISVLIPFVVFFVFVYFRVPKKSALQSS